MFQNGIVHILDVFTNAVEQETHHWIVVAMNHTSMSDGSGGSNGSNNKSGRSSNSNENVLGIVTADEFMSTIDNICQLVDKDDTLFTNFANAITTAEVNTTTTDEGDNDDDDSNLVKEIIDET